MAFFHFASAITQRELHSFYLREEEKSTKKVTRFFLPSSSNEKKKRPSYFVIPRFFVVVCVSFVFVDVVIFFRCDVLDLVSREERKEKSLRKRKR